MERITEANLGRLVASINRAAGTPEAPYTDKGEQFTCNAGNYHLDGAHGGWKLSQMVEGGGTRNVLDCGFISKRSLFDRMQAFLGGIEAAKA